MSIKQVVSYPLVRRSHTEWQVFLPRSHLTANPLLPCATWSFQANHGGGSKTSPCLQLCDSQVSRAPCCCSGNSKGGCWGFRVPWDERRIPPRTLGQWWGAASHENLGQFCRSKLLQQSSCNRSQSARGVKSCICLVLLFLSSSLFILFIFLLPALFYWHDLSVQCSAMCIFSVDGSLLHNQCVFCIWANQHVALRSKLTWLFVGLCFWGVLWICRICKSWRTTTRLNACSTDLLLPALFQTRAKSPVLTIMTDVLTVSLCHAMTL